MLLNLSQDSVFAHAVSLVFLTSYLDLVQNTLLMVEIPGGTGKYVSVAAFESVYVYVYPL